MTTSDCSNDVDTIATDDELVLLTDEDCDESEEQDDNVKLEESSKDEVINVREKSAIKLLLTRAPWFMIGLLILVAAVVLSQYRVHLPYEQPATNCTDVLNNDTTDYDEVNFTNTTNTTVIHYNTL